MKTINIEIYSDLICPWCYIGTRRMQAGLELLGKEFVPKVVWRPFQLNPDMPIEGMNRKTYRTNKFGSWGRSLAMDAEVAAIGKKLGIEFNYDQVLMTPNTLAGHRLLWWAQQRNHQDGPTSPSSVEGFCSSSHRSLAEALFRAYFTEGRDVGRHDVLVEIAGEVGFPRGEALLFLDSEVGKKEVVREALKGLELGLQGVPFFVVNDLPGLSGAQMPEAFLELFRQALGQDIHECGIESCKTG